MRRGVTVPDGVIEECRGLVLEETRREERVLEVVTQWAARPTASLPWACSDLAALKAMYRLLDNKAISA